MAVSKVKTYYKARLKRLRSVMNAKQYDACVIINDPDIYYFTGFGGEDSALVITPKKCVVVTDSRFVPQIKEECPGQSLLCRKGSIGQGIRQVISKGLTEKQYAKLVIVTAPDYISVSESKSLKKDIGKGLKAPADLIMPLRIIKDDYEVGRIKAAAKVAQDALIDTLDFMQVGMSEVEVAAKLEYEMARRNGGPPAFGSIVAFGGHAAHNHAVPSKRKLKKNDTILFDWGATVDGYRSDISRCFTVGKAKQLYKDAYAVCLASQMACIAAIAPGKSIAEVDAVARGIIKKSKFPVYGHGTGHGIGLDTHEQPGIGGKTKGVFEPGMVVTVEPGIYVEGQYGIRIEDDVLITETGYKIITSMPKDLDSLAR